MPSRSAGVLVIVSNASDSEQPVNARTLRSAASMAITLPASVPEARPGIALGDDDFLVGQHIPARRHAQGGHGVGDDVEPLGTFRLPGKCDDGGVDVHAVGDDTDRLLPAR